jgi:hypothetical protein
MEIAGQLQAEMQAETRTAWLLRPGKAELTKLSVFPLPRMPALKPAWRRAAILLAGPTRLLMPLFLLGYTYTVEGDSRRRRRPPALNPHARLPALQRRPTPLLRSSGEDKHISSAAGMSTLRRNMTDDMTFLGVRLSRELNEKL